MKTLLAPVDFSDVTDRIIAHAVDLAKSLPGKILLLHISEPLANYVPVGASMDLVATVPPPLEPQDTKGPAERLEKLAAPLRASGLTVETCSIIGLAVDDIVDQSVANKADYIILGSHGHGALYHLFSGSVVTGVLQKSECPVLVIPALKEKSN